MTQELVFPNGTLDLPSLMQRFTLRKSEHDAEGLIGECPIDHGIESTFDVKQTDNGWRITFCELGCHPKEIWAASVRLDERQPGEDDGESQAPALSMASAEFFASCDSKTEWLVEPYVCRGGFTLVQGAPKSGKTWLVAWIAACAVAQGHRVLFVEEEGAREVLRDRLVPFVAKPAPEALRIVFRKRIRLDNSKSVDALIEEIKAQKAALVVLDPFIALHGKKEKESDEMAMVLGAIRDMVSATGCAVLLVHHTRKGESWNKGSNAEASSEDARGSGALVGEVDHVIAVKGLPATKRKEGEIRIYVENPDTRIGAPFPRKLLSLDLATGRMAELDAGATKDPETAAADLLSRLLPLLPEPPASITRNALRASLRVRKDMLLDAVEMGVQQGSLISSVDGVSRGGGSRGSRDLVGTGGTTGTGNGSLVPAGFSIGNQRNHGNRQKRDEASPREPVRRSGSPDEEEP